MTYQTTWEREGVFRKYTGIVSGAELLQASQEVEADPRFDRIRYVINDFLDVMAMQVEEKDISLLAAIDNVAALSNPRIKIAVVATTDAVYELADLYSRLRQQSTHVTQCFNDLKTARDWSENAFINWYERYAKLTADNHFVS